MPDERDIGKDHKNMRGISKKNKKSATREMAKDGQTRQKLHHDDKRAGHVSKVAKKGGSSNQGAETSRDGRLLLGPVAIARRPFLAPCFISKEKKILHASAATLLASQMDISFVHSFDKFSLLTKPTLKQRRTCVLKPSFCSTDAAVRSYFF